MEAVRTGPVQCELDVGSELLKLRDLDDVIKYKNGGYYDSKYTKMLISTKRNVQEYTKA